MHLMADALLKYETIDHEQIDDIMAGKVPKPPEDWDSDTNNNLQKKVENKVVSLKPKDGKIGSPAGSH